MSFQHPRTPQSPSQVSPATSSDALHNTNTTASASASASTTNMSTATTLPTPAHSVNGASQQDIVMTDDSPHNKRKRSAEDDGDRESKKVHLEDRRMGIDKLHVDVGEKYLLCHQPHPESLPRMTEDLFEMYGLAGLAAEVAREKPNGEKNALRKTYKGHMKRLGVAGHFDVVKKPEEAPSDFLSLLSVPDLEWDVHQVKGQEIGDGLSEATLNSLGRATTMAKGPVPRNVWDTSVLGDLAPSNGDGSKPSSGKLTTPGTPMAGTPGVANRNPKLQPGNDPARPKRNIKKRGYGDSSFEGYADSFDDDAGYSTGEGEGGKRRKKSGNASPYPSAMRQQSYGPGMVGA